MNISGNKKLCIHHLHVGFVRFEGPNQLDECSGGQNPEAFIVGGIHITCAANRFTTVAELRLCTYVTMLANHGNASGPPISRK